jgi:integrase
VPTARLQPVGGLDDPQGSLHSQRRVTAGIRWRWVAVNPTDQAQPPAPPPSNPKPPTPTEAARILNAAASDPDLIAHLWLAMTTGGRRGELCALRWEDVDLERGTAALTGFKNGGQKRRVALDAESVQVLAEQFDRYLSRIEPLGLDRDPLAYVFSPKPDHSEPLNAPSVSQRYKRMETKLGIETHLHKLRHYSATELIGASVDVRTVAGRLGHADAITTLKIGKRSRKVRDAEGPSPGSVLPPY